MLMAVIWRYDPAYSQRQNAVDEAAHLSIGSVGSAPRPLQSPRLATKPGVAAAMNVDDDAIAPRGADIDDALLTMVVAVAGSAVRPGKRRDHPFGDRRTPRPTWPRGETHSSRGFGAFAGWWRMLVGPSQVECRRTWPVRNDRQRTLG